MDDFKLIKDLIKNRYFIITYIMLAIAYKVLVFIPYIGVIVSLLIVIIHMRFAFLWGKSRYQLIIKRKLLDALLIIIFSFIISFYYDTLFAILIPGNICALIFGFIQNPLYSPKKKNILSLITVLFFTILTFFMLIGAWFLLAQT